MYCTDDRCYLPLHEHEVKWMLAVKWKILVKQRILVIIVMWKTVSKILTKVLKYTN